MVLFQQNEVEILKDMLHLQVDMNCNSMLQLMVSVLALDGLLILKLLLLL